MAILGVAVVLPAAVAGGPILGLAAASSDLVLALLAATL